MAARRWYSVSVLGAALTVLSALTAGLVPGCLDRREHDQPPAADQACAACHGDPSREEPGVVDPEIKKLLKAAPPRDLSGNVDESTTSAPGVGSHWIHLRDTSTHLAFACAECHVIPKTTGEEGHADSDRPAEIVFATDPDIKTLVKLGDRNPSYDETTRRCADTYCHKASDAVWNAPRSSEEACGTCHGLPPPAPHPTAKLEQCTICHADTVDATGNIKDPSKHVNGVIDVKPMGCIGCHGDDTTPAPPKDTSGNTVVSAIGVGAHRVHLAGGANSRPLACGECHVVPTAAEDPGHADTPLPAELTITGVAASDGRNPVWDHESKRCSDTWCHGPSASAPSPEWTSEAGNLACTACHGQPPAWPHPQMTQCSRCHGAVVDTDNVTIKAKDKHVNGTVDVVPLTACTDCHGSTNPAPPVDIAGNTATTSPGVGAHQQHLAPSSIPARPVQCPECHQVPATWDAVGHIDTMLPAELSFSGVATAWGATPSYTNGKCENTYCHGALQIQPSGGSLMNPTWNEVGTGQVGCTTCHGFPPPDFWHQQNPGPCFATCHTKFNADPTTHINGVINVYE